MRVLIIENTEVTHHGQLGVALHEAAARIEVIKPWRGDAIPLSADHDALVVFGGEQSALDDAAFPYLGALAELMADYSAKDRAVLGICLGCQILARAFGAQNRLDCAHEFGWSKVGLTQAGQEDPLFQALPDVFDIFQWHSDSFTPPKGAVHLAGSAIAPQQAFRIGRASYGTQFHFEASCAVVADWTRQFPDRVEANQQGWIAALPALAADQGAKADQHGLSIARAWVKLIRPA